MTGAIPPRSPLGRRRKVLAAFAIAAAVLLALMVVILESTGSSSDPAAPVPTSSVPMSSSMSSHAHDVVHARAPTIAETVPGEQGNGHGRNGPKKPKERGGG